MMMRHVKLLALGLLLGGLSVKGCSCPGGSVVVDEVDITFEFPANGDTIASPDDVNSAEGIQVNVRVTAGGVQDGQTLLLSNDRNRDGSGLPITTAATVQNEVAEFPGYTLPTGRVELRAALEDTEANDTCATGRCDEITINVVETICLFNTPRDGDVLTQDQYANVEPFDPFDIDVTLDCRGLSNGDNVALTVNGGLPQVAQVDGSGRAVITQAALGEGPNVLAALPGTDASGRNPSGTQSSATVTVDTDRCLVNLTHPIDGSTLLEFDDEQQAVTGMQVDLDVATDCDDNPTINVYVDDGGPGGFIQIYPPGNPDEARGSFTHPLGTRFVLPNVSLPESIVPGAYDVEVVATIEDAGGQGVSLPTHYWVDSVVPEILPGSYSPVDGTCLGPSFDRDATRPGLQIEAIGRVLAVEQGAEVWVRVIDPAGPHTCTTDADCADASLAQPPLCRQELCMFVGPVIGQDFAVPVDVPNGQVDLQYYAADQAGNFSVPILLDVLVFDASPTIDITAPTDDQVITSADDVSLTDLGLQFNVQLALTDVPPGSIGTVRVSGASFQPFAPPVGDSTPLLRVNLADGQRTITAVVTDACGTPSQAEVDVTVTSTAAQLAVVAYEAGTFRAVANGGITLAAAADYNVITGAGITDRLVTIDFFDDATTDVPPLCAGNATNPQFTGTILAAQSQLVASGQALGPGVNCATITVDDQLTPPISAAYVITRRTATSAPSITTPAGPSVTWTSADDSDANASNGFNQTIVVTLTPTADADGVLTLREAGTGSLIATQDVTAGASTVTFTNVSLQPGVYDVEAHFADVYGLSATSAALSVDIFLLGPHIVITSVAAGGYYNNADFEVVIQDRGTGTTPENCLLRVDGVQVASGSWAGGPTFTLDAVIAEGPHTIRVECVDSVPDTGFHELAGITIDDTAPDPAVFVDEPVGTPGQILWVDQAWVNGDVPFTGGGSRHVVTIEVDALTESLDYFRAELTSTPATDAGDIAETQIMCLREAGGGAVDPTCDLTRLVVPSLTQPVSYPSVAFGVGTEGELAFSLVMVDRAGNASTPVAVTLRKDALDPVVTQLQPSPATAILTSSTDEDQGTPNIVEETFVFDVDGAVDPAPDCSTSPGATCLRLTMSPPPVSPGAAAYHAAVPASGQVSFPQMAFNDDVVNGYVAEVQIEDVAGNLGSSAYTFFVQAQEPRLVWGVPTPDGGINASDAALINASTIGIAPNTSAVLCSTVLPASIPELTGSCDPTSQPGCPCRWGQGGVAVGPNAGFVLRRAFVSGNLQSGIASFVGVELGQGSQVLHVEAREADLVPDVYSAFHTFAVDTIVPTVSDFTLDANDPGNDGARLRLSAAEGTPGACLTTPVSLSIADAEEGQPIRILRNGSTDVQVGTPTVGPGGAASFDVCLAAGLSQRLTVRVFDQAGNQNPGLTAIDVDVDFTPPTASITDSGVAVYTSLNASPNDAGTPGVRGDDYVDVTATVSANDTNLDGGSVVVTVYDAPTGGNVRFASPPVAISGGPAAAVPVQVRVSAGHNYLEAVVTDPFGNTRTTTRDTQDADFHGPVVLVEMWDGSGSAGGAEAQVCGASIAGACLADTLPPDASSRVQLDRDGPTDTYCSPVGQGLGECSTDGSDLRITLLECSNSAPDLENCAATPINGRVEGRLAGGGGTFNVLAGGAFTISGDIPVMTSLFDQPGSAAYRLSPGLVRELRVHATDRHGNPGTSGSIFIKINQGGISPEVVLLDGGVPPAPFDPTVDLANVDGGGEIYLGSAVSVAPVATNFAANLRVTMPVVDGGSIPTDVALVCSSPCRGGSTVLSPDVAPTCVSGCASSTPVYVAEFYGVTVPTSTPTAPLPQTFVFDIDCGVSACGSREYEGIIADVVAPTYQFDRCSLCALGVPFPGAPAAPACTGCGAHNTNTASDISGPVLWNSTTDAVPASASTYSMTAGRPLSVLVRGLEDGQDIRIASSAGGLAGNVLAAVTGCTSSVSSCTRSFTALEVPSLPANASRHLLTVDITDAAGNVAVPLAERCVDACDPMDEVITAQVDTIRPEGVAPTVCIGESTTPNSGNPANAVEDAQCAAWCASTGSCSRTGGLATLHLAGAPGDDGDGSSSNNVQSYAVVVAGLGVRYGTTTHTSCSTVVEAAGVGVEAALTPTGAVVPPGDEQLLAISGLYPHRDYCIAVVGIDDAGNRTNVAGFQVERALPLLTDVPGMVGGPDVVTFDPLAPNDDDPTAALAASAGLGRQVVGIADLDNDDLGDFAVTAFDNAPLRFFAIDFYLSSRGPGVPVRINGPTAAGTGGIAAGFGLAIASGDLDDDGIGDVAICSANYNNGRGALFLYYGEDNAGTTNDGIDESERLLPSNPLRANYPDMVPDVTLAAEVGSTTFCTNVAMGNVDGLPGDDLVIAVAQNGTPRRVFGYYGGGRNRFPDPTPGDPTDPTVINAALTVVGTSNWDPTVADFPLPGGPGTIGSPDFSLQPASGYGQTFPLALALADLDGNGAMDVVVSDHTATHGGAGAPSGEVYVFRGGWDYDGGGAGTAGLRGAVAAPNSVPAQLMHLVRYVQGVPQFGGVLGRIPAPRAGDAADWLYVKVDTQQPLLYKAEAGLGIVPDNPVTVPNPQVFPVGGASTYALDPYYWDGTTLPAQAGTTLAVLGELDGMAGVDIALAPGSVTANAVWIYSYDASFDIAGSSGFRKRAILRGSTAGCGTIPAPPVAACSFGFRVGGVVDYTGAGSGASVLVTTWESTAPDGMVHRYR